MPSGWSYFRYWCRAVVIYLFFLTPQQVLTGVQPFRHIRPHEFAFHVTLGARPEKPADAEVVGISNSLWELIRKCWDGDKGRRPGIQEVVAGVGDAAASWGTEMPPNSIEHREDSVEDASEELNHGKLPSLPVALFFHGPPVQLEYSSLMKPTLVQSLV